MDNVPNPSGTASGDGFDITFDSSAANSINTFTGVGNPGGPPVTLAPQESLTAFDGPGSAVGTWTLYIEDTQPFFVGQLNSWSVTVNGVPDNGSTFTLLALGLGGLGLCGLRRQPRLAPAATRK